MFSYPVHRGDNRPGGNAALSQQAVGHVSVLLIKRVAVVASAAHISSTAH
jgi:hypothetical protein